MRIFLAILLLSVVNYPPAAAEESPTRPTLVLVPSVQRGHSTMWKTGAIITVTSVGVSLLGAALTVHGLGDPDYGGGGNGAEFWAGIAMSIAGDGGLVLGGPLTWIAGIDRDPDAAR
jgi:hypothetical protein